MSKLSLLVKSADDNDERGRSIEFSERMIDKRHVDRF